MESPIKVEEIIQTSEHFQEEKRGQTKVKHAILKSYLGAWFAIMGQTFTSDVIFVDGFAGAGTYEDNRDMDQAENIGDDQMGSPLIAYFTLITHKLKDNFKGTIHLYFIEADTNNFKQLKRVFDYFIERNPFPPNVKVSLINAPFHDEMPKILARFPDVEYRPLFAFVDPFGIKGVPMSLMRQIISRRASEVFVSVMYGYMNRRLGNMQEKYQENFKILLDLDESDWCQMRDNLRDNNRPCMERQREFRDCYVKQLGAAFPLKFTMRNKQNRYTYDLIFATGHMKGFISMKTAMLRQVQGTPTEPDHFYFSEFDHFKLIEFQESGGDTGASNSKWVSPKLMTEEERLKDLESRIVGNFQSCSWVTGKMIEDFIWLKTPYKPEKNALKKALRSYLCGEQFPRMAFDKMVFMFPPSSPA